MNVTEEELELMTPAEREAYMNDDETENKLVAELAADDDDAGSLDSESSDNAAAPAPAAAPAAAPAPATDDEFDPADLDQAPEAPFVATVPADADAKIAAAKAKEAAAFKSLMDGDIEQEEFERVKNEARAEEMALREERLKADIAANMQQQAAARAWERACKTFAAHVKRTDGLDYDIPGGPNVMWDHHIRLLASNPANADKPASFFLTEAHKAVMASLGRTPKAAPAPTLPAPRAPADRSGLPPVTTASLPAASDAATQDDEFAHLRGLEGEDYEKAIARLTQDQLDRFMGG